MASSKQMFDLGADTQEGGVNVPHPRCLDSRLTYTEKAGFGRSTTFFTYKGGIFNLGLIL